MDGEPIIVSAIAGVSSIGGNINQTCCAIRAGLNLFEEHALFNCEPHDIEWDPALPLVAAMVHFNDPNANGFNRLILMAVQALKEILEKLKFSRKDLSRCGLFLALPELDKVTNNWGLRENFINTLCGKTGLTGLAVKNINFEGRTGVVHQFQSAKNLIDEGELDYCIIAGVDSYLAADRIKYFDEHWRVKSDRSLDGFIPGEGCAMFAIENIMTASSRAVQPMAIIDTVAFDHEAQPITGNKQSTAIGSSQVLQSVLKRVLQQNNRVSPIEWTLSDMNSESYTGREWGVVLARNHVNFADNHRLDHPVDCVGEIGAAIGSILVCVAAHAFKNKYYRASEVYLTLSADSGDRAGMLLKQF